MDKLAKNVRFLGWLHSICDEIHFPEAKKTSGEGEQNNLWDTDVTSKWKFCFQQVYCKSFEFILKLLSA